MDRNPQSLDLEIALLPLDQLQHLEINARYMTADQQKRLTDNIKRDGDLTSLPLVWLVQAEDGTVLGDKPAYLIISGNHRVISARDAGMTEIRCIVIRNWISEERRIEIQLAHNAVTGQDDLSILEKLYEGLSLSGKEYSGLNDDAFGSLKNLSLTGFNVDGPDYQEITLTFLPEDAEQFEALITRAAKSKRATQMLARYQDFDALFDAIVRAKTELNIQNNAVAIGIIAQLAIERLDEIEAVAEGELVE